MRTFGKTALAAATVGVIGLGMTFGGAVAANAASPTVLSGAGSDTIYFVMSGSPASGATNPHTGLDHLFNASTSSVNVTEIPPSNSAIGGFPASVTVPADAACPSSGQWNSDGSVTWDSGPHNTPPNGSSAGITSLQNDDAGAHPGCLVDFARSSRGLGNPSDTSDLESYAFALDAVDWAVIGGTGANANKNAPSTLSVSQLAKIYTCKANGTPIYSNWSQVGGKNAPIVKYAPQAGSGTLSFFQTKLLGGATVDSGCNSANLSNRAEENQLTNRCVSNDPTCNSGQEAIPAADLSKLIAPFSYAKYNSQKAGSEPDLRNGAKLEKVEGIAPTSKTVNEGLVDGQPQFLGTRYVYNILTQNEPTYAASASYVGINQIGTPTNGFLCQNKTDAASVKSHKAILAVYKAFGFTPLTSQVEGSGQPTGYCRFDATPL